MNTKKVGLKNINLKNKSKKRNIQLGGSPPPPATDEIVTVDPESLDNIITEICGSDRIETNYERDLSIIIENDYFKIPVKVLFNNNHFNYINLPNVDPNKYVSFNIKGSSKDSNNIHTLK